VDNFAFDRQHLDESDESLGTKIKLNPERSDSNPAIALAFKLEVGCYDNRQQLIDSLIDSKTNLDS